MLLRRGAPGLVFVGGIGGCGDGGVCWCWSLVGVLWCGTRGFPLEGVAGADANGGLACVWSSDLQLWRRDTRLTCGSLWFLWLVAFTVM